MKEKKLKSLKRTVQRFDWGDGHLVKVQLPNLDYVPGTLPICPVPCHPIGETPAEWIKRSEKTAKK